MLAWFFVLVTMTWQGHITSSYIGPFPSKETCLFMRERTAMRLVEQQRTETWTIEACELQTPK
jgi:hypothetical protein